MFLGACCLFTRYFPREHPDSSLRHRVAELEESVSESADQVGAGVDVELLSNSPTFECQNPQLPAGSH